MANKIFFPPGGVKTFSDNLVGLQITDGGGLTQGNFQFTTAIYEKSNRKFDTGIFSDAYTLENLKIDDIQQAKRIIEKNFKDIFELSSRSVYSSGKYYYQSRGVYAAHLKKFLGDREPKTDKYYDKLLYRPQSDDLDDIEL